MQAVWTLAGLGVLGAIITAFWWSTARTRLDDLGLVSQQWLSEHRHSQSHDERR